MENEKRIAILIDSDNISPKYLKDILAEVARYGRITYKRIYGDWSAQNLSTWRRLLLDSGFLQIQQARYVGTKNSTDAAMIIDAMDILYGAQVDVFCLVTSDSDFSRLAIRLKEAGMEVIGMGERKTPSSFVGSCTMFKYLDVLADDDEEAEVPEAASAKPDSEEDSEYKIANKKEIMAAIRNFVQSAAADTNSDERGINISTVGLQLQKQFPEFDVRNYGFSKLSTFLESLHGVSLEYDGLKVFMKLNDAKKPIDKNSTIKLIKDMLTANGGSAKISELNAQLTKKLPSFDVHNLGYSKLSTFLSEQPQFEVKWNTVKLK